LTGSSAADSLVGGAGNDTIIGNGGADSINGGANNDTFVFASEANLTGAGTVIGGDGSGDIISLTASGTYTDAIFTKVTGVEILSLANTVAGSGVVLGTLALADGLTSVAGSTHNDSITLSAAFTALTVNGGSNTGSDSVVVSATTSAEVITVLQVAAVTSSSGSDTITVGTANTTNVTILAGAGNDTITLGGTGTYSAVVDGADGNDSVVLSSSFTGGFAVSVTNVETLTGSSVADTITLTGTVGTVVDAGAGSDTITVAASSTSAYSLSGGAGNDTFVFADTQSLTSVASVIGGDGAGDILSLTASGAYTDAIFTKVTGVEILNLASTVAGSTVVLGTLALADGLTSVAGSTHNDSITLSTAFTALTVNGGSNTGSDSVIVQATTSAEVITVLQIATVTSSSGSDTITVGTANTTNVTISAGAGNDTITLGGTGTYSAVVDGADGNDSVVLSSTFTGGFAVSVTNVETVTGSSVADSITLNGTVATVVDGGAGNDIITVASSPTTNAYSLSGGAGNDTFVFANEASLTSAATVIGGDGSGDILSITTAGTFTDAIFTKVTGVEILSLVNTVSGSGVVLGTLALADGLTSVAGSTHNDSITLSAAFTALTIDGGANTGSDVVTFAATGGETVSVLNIAQVTVSATVTAAEALTVLSTAVGSITVDLGAGTDTVALGNTFGYTINASNVETITGNSGNDVVTGTVSIGTFDGGAGTDSYVFTTGDLTITVANVETITGVSGSSETVVLASANSSTITLANVNTLTGSSGNDLISATLALTSAETLVYSGGSGDDTLIVNIGVTGTLSSSVSVFGGAGNDTITVADTYTAGSFVHFLNGGAGADSITGTTGYDVIQISIANDLQATTTFSLADYIFGGTATAFAGFATLTDVIDITGGSLTSANGTTLNVLTSTASNGTSTNNATFTSSTASTAADFADITTTYQSTNLFFINDTITGSFVTQASIDAAVTVLTGKVATGDTTVGTKVIFVFNDGDSANSAIFQYTEAGTTGIQASEVKLVAVVVGHGDLSSTNFV